MGTSLWWFLLALVVLAVILTLIMALAWALLRYYYLPLLDPSYAIYGVLIQLELLNLWLLLVTLFYLVPMTLANAVFSTLATINANWRLIFFLSLACTGSLVWMELHLASAATTWSFASVLHDRIDLPVAHLWQSHQNGVQRGDSGVELLRQSERILRVWSARHSLQVCDQHRSHQHHGLPHQCRRHLIR